MDRIGTPVPTLQQVQESVKKSVDNPLVTLDSSATLTNDCTAVLTEGIELCGVKPKELDTFIKTFSSSSLDATYANQKKRERISVENFTERSNDFSMTVERALEMSVQMNEQYKSMKNLDTYFTHDTALIKELLSNSKKASKSKNSEPNGKRSKHGPKIKVKITISESFAWNRTQLDMYSGIEQNRELVCNLSKEQRDFLQDCYDKVYASSLEMDARETAEELASVASQEQLSDSKTNNELEKEEEIVCKSSLLLPIDVSNLEEQLEDLCLSENEKYSSYLDFEDFSTSPDKVLINVLEDNDIVKEKPFIEQVFEEKMKKMVNISNLLNPETDTVDEINSDVEEEFDQESLNLTPVSAHSTIKAQNISPKNPKDVLDELMGVKPERKYTAFCDDLF